MNLESPLLGIVRGDEASSVRVIANLGFTDMTLNVRDRSTDLLSGQEIYGELLIAPGEVFWLSTTSARS